jgi:transposase
MLTLPPAVKVYLAAEPVDLRKSFDALALLVSDVLRQDPLSGHLFVFRNRRGHLCRILFWDRTGYAVFTKRLERGRFHLPVDVPEGQDAVTVDGAQLGLMLEGLDLRQAHPRRRYRSGESWHSWR